MGNYCLLNVSNRGKVGDVAREELEAPCKPTGTKKKLCDYGLLEPQPITVILRELAAGDSDALNRLIPLVYVELRRLADSYLRNERPGNTLQPTALVHEVYIRLVGQHAPGFSGRAHFLGTASHIMRQILIDHARSRNASKRGGGMPKYSLDEAINAAVERPPLMLAIDDALCELERIDPKKTKLIEMRFFGGLTAQESSEVLGLPVEKVRGELRLAQAWLHRRLNGRPKPKS